MVQVNKQRNNKKISISLSFFKISSLLSKKDYGLHDFSLHSLILFGENDLTAVWKLHHSHFLLKKKITESNKKQSSIFN